MVIISLTENVKFKCTSGPCLSLFSIKCGAALRKHIFQQVSLSARQQ